MDGQLVKKFGSVLSAQILPTEIEQRDCPDVLFPVILLLRLLLGSSLSVFYKTVWEADDGDTHYTKVFVYDAGSQYHAASFQEIASAHVDTAISLFWEEQHKDGLETVDSSHGVIRWLNINTPLGATIVDAKEAVLMLLRLAASASYDYELLVEAAQEGVVGLKLRSYKTEATELTDIGLLRWSTTRLRCNRFSENRGDCAFQLK